MTEGRARVAFQRGPIAFSMEQLDQSDHAQGMNLADYTVYLNENTTANFDSELLGGVMVLAHPGAIRGNQPYSDRHRLYFSAATAAKAEQMRSTLNLIPNYAWANRGRDRNGGLDPLQAGRDVDRLRHGSAGGREIPGCKRP
nr:hypothetical protein [Edaphobacter aggregans]